MKRIIKFIEFCFAGANPTVTTATGRTPVGLACMKNYPDILSELLLACSNYVPYSSYDTTTGTSSNDKTTAVSEPKKWRKQHDTFENVTPEGMEGLQWEDEITSQTPKPDQIEENANTNKAEKDDEWSVLYRYYASVIEKTGEMLANTISAREPHCLDAFRQAPIHYAASAGSFKCMELLLKYNAPVNMTTNSGHTALHLSVHEPKVVELLLQHKASPNKLTFYDQLAPIHIAAKIGNTETVSGHETS